MTDGITPRPRRVKTNVAPFIKAGETNDKLNRHWRTAFLAILAETSNVSLAAERAGVSSSRAYYVRRSEPPFERQWFAALCEGYDHLEMEVLRRLRDSDFVTPSGGKYDFGAALRIMAAHRATVGRHRAELLDQDEDEVLASIDATFEKILAGEKAARELFGKMSNPATGADD
ncbi:MAG: hypothetical protein ABIP41_07440 [Croceibacterium sp.]